MGNCSLKGVAAAQGPNSVRIMTDSGGFIEFEGPKFVGEVLSDFQGYGIFGQGRASSPLPDHEKLHGGQFYYLLPLGKVKLARHSEEASGLNKKPVNEAEPVRMSTSVDIVTNLKNGSAVEVLPPPQKGVWRVKLVIDTKQLEEILSEEVNIEALIEQMRMAATSAGVTPRRTKISWGLSWKPILTSVFKVPVDHRTRVQSPDFCTGSP